MQQLGVAAGRFLAQGLPVADISPISTSSPRISCTMPSNPGSNAERKKVLLVVYWQLVTITCQSRSKPSGAGISSVPSGVLSPNLDSL